MRNTFPILFFLVLGAGGFYGGMTWFRSHAAVTQEMMAGTEKITDVFAPASVSAALAVPTHTDLISAFDGQVTGAINRTLMEKTADHHVLAYLPAIDQASETYVVWLLKDGLADVKRMGELAPRADGSWVLDFTSGPTSGISDPQAYRALVVMKEMKGSSSMPSGVKMAEAAF